MSREGKLVSHGQSTNHMKAELAGFRGQKDKTGSNYKDIK